MKKSLTIGFLFFSLWANLFSQQQAQFQIVQSTDNPCDGSIAWNWNGVLNAGNLATARKNFNNWKFRVQIHKIDENRFIRLHGLHETEAPSDTTGGGILCHSGDARIGDDGFSGEIKLPLEGSGITDLGTVVVKHRTDRGEHSDTYKFEINRGVVGGNNTISIQATHNSTPPTPKKVGGNILPWVIGGIGWGLLIAALIVCIRKNKSRGNIERAS